MKNTWLNLMGATLLLATLAPVSAQTTVSAAKPSYAPVPFGPGERMTYEVKLGFIGKVGKGSMEVTSIDTVHGFPTYLLRMRIEGGIPFAHVKDDYQSWLDVQKLVARRFKQDQHEVNYKRKRTLEFFPAERRWTILGKNESGTMPTDEPLDDLSFLYFVRTLPLRDGETYTLHRYWKDDGNPVTVKVLRRETVTVPAGKFNTVVVQPIIKSKGLFSEGGQAEVYFTDDERRIPVQIKSKVKVLKSLNMFLTSYSPGHRMSPPFSPRSTSPQ